MMLLDFLLIETGFETMSEQQRQLVTRDALPIGVSIFGRREVSNLPPSPGADFIITNVIDKYNEGQPALDWPECFQPDYKKPASVYSPFEIQTPSSQNLDNLGRWLASAALARDASIILLDARVASRTNRTAELAGASVQRKIESGVAGMAIYAWGYGQLQDEVAESRASGLKSIIKRLEVPTIELEVFNDELGIYYGAGEADEYSYANPMQLFTEQNILVAEAV